MNHRPTRLSMLTWMATAGAALLVATLVAAPAQASAPRGSFQSAAIECNTGDQSVVGSLAPGDILCNGFEVYSFAIADNGLPVNRVIMQTDGNMVAYDQWGHARWVAPAWHAGWVVIMQTDGNLVIYNASGGAVWASNTAGNPGAWLKVQDDGNSVIYLGDTGRALWVNGKRTY